MSQNHDHTIPLLMQSSFTYGCLCGFYEITGCLINVDDMVTLEAHEKCELLRSLFRRTV